jgi:hypothetical protein
MHTDQFNRKVKINNSNKSYNSVENTKLIMRQAQTFGQYRQHRPLDILVQTNTDPWTYEGCL